MSLERRLTKEAMMHVVMNVYTTMIVVEEEEEEDDDDDEEDEAESTLLPPKLDPSDDALPSSFLEARSPLIVVVQLLSFLVHRERQKWENRLLHRDSASSRR